MSASSDLQTAIAAILATPGVLSVPAAVQGATPLESGTLPIVQRRTKEILREIEAAIANHGLCLWVMPSLPLSAVETNDGSVVFLSKVENRVRIVEQPAINKFEIDAYDLIDEVMLGLSGKIVAGMTSIPFCLAPRPCEMVEDPKTRIIDVIFHTAYGLLAS